MIGISVYLSKENEGFNKEWIEKASKSGFTSIFTSLHIPEDDPRTHKELLYKLGMQAKSNNMELIADLSPKSFQYLGLDLHDADTLLDWGLTGLRVDYGFSTKDIVELSNKLKVSLNASTLTEQFLDELIKSGLNTKNTEAAHNFYPRPETGLSKEYFIKKSKLLKSFNISISAFIAGDGEKRQPLYQGLPTLEAHRQLSPISAYLDMKENCFVDSVYIGDPSLNESTLSKFPLLMENVIPVRFKGENEVGFEDLFNYLDRIQKNRLDPAQEVIRVENSRVDLHNNSNLEPKNSMKRVKGSVTIDNENYGRYAGEIHIALNDLKRDPKVNVIGHVIEEDIPLLKYIGGGVKFLLRKIN